MKLQLTDRIQVRFAAGGLCAEILAAESSRPSALSEETLAKSWKEDLPDETQKREEFPEHGNSWFAFELEAIG